jgi:predicted ArsR family transcriptional regulator
VSCGLLEARVGPAGAPRRVGRAPKVYRPVEGAVQVSIPPRTHDDLASILIDATTSQRRDETPEQARLRAARAAGQALAESDDSPSAGRGRLGAERALTLTERVLAARGYEPYRAAPDRLRLRNCPFHPLAQRAPDLVCGINEAFLDGLLTGLDARSIEAVLAPAPGECCVEIRHRGRP